MMTVTSLRKQAFHLMKTDKEGSYKGRKRRAFVLDKMLHGLYADKHTPATWQAMETRHIHSLVKRWKEQKIKPSTIMRYMTIIRKILTDLDCHVPYIDNKSLQLSRPKPRKKRIKMTADFWQCLSKPCNRIIMALQTHFGLTFNEAILIKPSGNIQDYQLTISADVAFNAVERNIPIYTDQQRAILHEFSQLINSNSNLIKKYGRQLLRIDWCGELKKHTLPSNKSWRYWYAKQRFEMLSADVEQAQIYQTIKEEMGIKSRNTLWLYLHSTK